VGQAVAVVATAHTVAVVWIDHTAVTQMVGHTMAAVRETHGSSRGHSTGSDEEVMRDNMTAGVMSTEQAASKRMTKGQYWAWLCGQDIIWRIDGGLPVDSGGANGNEPLKSWDLTGLTPENGSVT
jgi:hypothetical protein